METGHQSRVLGADGVTELDNVPNIQYFFIEFFPYLTTLITIVFCSSFNYCNAVLNLRCKINIDS